MLHGVERVQTPAQARAEGGGGGGPIVIQLIQDGRKTAEVVAPYLPGVVKQMVG